MNVVEEMKRLTERYAELEAAKDAVEKLLDCIYYIDLPDGIEGSHHSEMEWSETHTQIENEMQAIEDRIR
jgi:ribosomal protein S1